MSSKHYSLHWKNCTKYVLINFGTYETCELRSERVYNFYMKYTVYKITIKTWLQREFFSPCATNYWRYYATHTLSVFSLPHIRCYNPSRHNRLYSGDKVRISAGSSATLRYSAVFQSLNENAGAVHPLGRNRVLPNPVHFAIHSTVWHFCVSVTDRKVNSIDQKKVTSGCTSTNNKSNIFIYACSYAELPLERESETYRTAWQLETLEMKASPWTISDLLELPNLWIRFNTSILYLEL
jgi:hypothetical protein